MKGKKVVRFPKTQSTAFNKDLDKNQHQLRGVVVDRYGHKILFGYTQGMHMLWAKAEGLFPKNQSTIFLTDKDGCLTEELGHVCGGGFERTYPPVRGMTPAKLAVQFSDNIDKVMSGKTKTDGGLHWKKEK